MKLPWKGSRSFGTRFALIAAAAFDRRFRFFLCCTATIAAVAFSFLNPQIIRFTIDSCLGRGSSVNAEGISAYKIILDFTESFGGVEFLRRNLWIPAGFIMAAALLSALCHIIRRYFCTEIGETVAWRLHNILYEHIHKLPYEWHVECQTGDIAKQHEKLHSRSTLLREKTEVVSCPSQFRQAGQAALELASSSVALHG